MQRHSRAQIDVASRACDAFDGEPLPLARSNPLLAQLFHSSKSPPLLLLLEGAPLMAADEDDDDGGFVAVKCAWSRLGCTPVLRERVDDVLCRILGGQEVRALP